MQNFFPKKGSTIALAMSGGIDSTMSAIILLEKGYSVSGFWLWMFGEKKGKGYAKAKEIAEKLGIGFKVFDIRKEFENAVIKNYLQICRAGDTPNPCVICNKLIKFGFVPKIVKQNLNSEFIATGHYAKKIKYGKNWAVCTGTDLKKDQTYFLYSINKNIIDKIVFPISDYYKENLWKMAEDKGFEFEKEDESREICFIKNHQVFLQKSLEDIVKSGEVININGKKIGTHKGLPFFTIGQRAGFQMNLKTPNTAKFFVVGKNRQKNQLVVGGKKDVFVQEFTLKSLNWLTDRKDGDFLVKIRNTGEFLKLKIKTNGSETKVKLDKPAYGICPGQSAVFYKKHRDCFIMLGGGTIRV